MAFKVLAVAALGSLLGASAGETGGVTSRTSECFEYGYDYSGFDLHQVPFIGSPAACMEECQGYRGCGVWTYDTASHMCYLKSAGAFTSRIPGNSLVSGPRLCTFSQTCYDVGYDYYGHDVERVEGRYVMTPMDCQRLCSSNPQCAFFSWKFSTHSCYLKTSSAILNRREDSDVTSGPRTCSSSGTPSAPSPSDFPTEFDPATAPPACVEVGVDYRGYNIKTVKAKSSPACHRECQQLKECQYWTWSAQNGVCYLKTADAVNGRLESAGTLDRVSGSRSCIPVLPGCQFADVGIIGARLSTRTASSFDICQIHCATHASCTHFSHHVLSGECTLWSSFNTYSQGISTQGLVSGPAFCDAEEVCYEQSDYVGYNVDEIETGEVKSPAACQKLCRQNADCHYWTWLRENNGCYLKDANALLGRSNDVTSIGRFSGPKWCTVSYGCILINAVYTGLSFQYEEAENYQTCAGKCASNSFCTAWTYHTDLGFCSLFSGGASLAKMPVRGAVSGDRECTTEIHEEENCFEEGILYKSDKALGVVEAETADECYVKCWLKDGCSRWSLKNEMCYLLPNEAQPSFVYDPSSTSGPNLCQDNTFYSVKDQVYQRGKLGEAPVYTPGGCMRKCSMTPKCLYWVFSYGETGFVCTMFDKSAEGSATDAYKTIVGEMLPPAMVASQCGFSDVLTTVPVEKPMQCQDECQANIQCEAWQSKVTRQADGTDLVTCTLYKSAENPTKVNDPNTKCGSKIPPGSITLNVSCSAEVDKEVVLEANTIAGCYGACSANPECVAWTFDFWSACIGYKENPLELSKEIGIAGKIERSVPVVLFNTSYGSSEKSAATAAIRLASAFRKRIAVRAAAASQPAPTLNDCITSCSEDSSCIAWTFKEGACSTFSSAKPPVKEDGAISGRKSTTPLPWSFQLGKKFSGDPAGSWSAASAGLSGQADPAAAADDAIPATAMECAAKAEKDQCWSFKSYPDGNVCHVYEKEMCNDTTEEEGFVSGTPNADK